MRSWKVYLSEVPLKKQWVLNVSRNNILKSHLDQLVKSRYAPTIISQQFPFEGESSFPWEKVYSLHYSWTAWHNVIAYSPNWFLDPFFTLLPSWKLISRDGTWVPLPLASWLGLVTSRISEDSKQKNWDIYHSPLPLQTHINSLAPPHLRHSYGSSCFPITTAVWGSISQDSHSCWALVKLFLPSAPLSLQKMGFVPAVSPCVFLPILVGKVPSALSPLCK